ncbi:MAG: hypothetical protein ACE5HA_12315 [Anaerolineae bacterium]
MTKKPPLTQTRIFWFWLPLAAMWLMMAFEQPAIAAVVARLPDPERSLAAIGVTFSLALIVESPIIMLLTAGTALSRGKQSYERLLNFTHILSATLMTLHVVIALTPLFGFIVGGLIGAPAEIIEPSRQAFLLMTPWTPAIAYRRLWQGVLIRFDRTGVVPLTIAARIAASGVVLVSGILTRRLSGASLGGLALSVGVIAAAVASYVFARSTIREHLSSPALGDAPLPWRDLLEFYVPLALTSFITLVGRPVLTFGLARAPQPLASLAVWPVIMGFIFLARSFAFSYQEVVVALLVDGPSFEKLSRFTMGLALFLSGLFALIVITPAARLWFEKVSGLTPDLVALALTPTMVLVLLPGLDTLLSWQRGLMVHVGRTRAITQAVVLDVVVLVVVMLGVGAVLPLAGATMAAVALTSAVGAEWVYLRWRSRPSAAQVRAVPAGPGD